MHSSQLSAKVSVIPLDIIPSCQHISTKYFNKSSIKPKNFKSFILRHQKSVKIERNKIILSIPGGNIFMETVGKPVTYSSKDFEEYIHAYWKAMENNDKKLLEEMGLKIYEHLHNLIEKLMKKCNSLLPSAEHDDMYMEIWAGIWGKFKDYDHHQGQISTYIIRDIRHVIDEYISSNKYHTSPYYAKNIKKLLKAIEECEQDHITVTPELIRSKTGQSLKTIKTCMEMLKTYTNVSMDALLEAGYDPAIENWTSDTRMSYQSDENQLSVFLRKYLSAQDSLFFEEYIYSSSKTIIGFCRERAAEFKISPEEMKKRILRAKRMLKNIFPKIENYIGILAY